MDKRDFKRALRYKTCCCIQHNGWPCGTCFFAISEELINRDWQTVLLYRGDYKETDLDNLPPKKERKEVLEKIYNLCIEKQ
jgi:hypothetical protein